MSINFLEHVSAEVGWKAFRGELDLERAERLKKLIALHVFRKAPHHRCDICREPLTQIRGPRCTKCLETSYYNKLC